MGDPGWTGGSRGPGGAQGPGGRLGNQVGLEGPAGVRDGWAGAGLGGMGNTADEYRGLLVGDKNDLKLDSDDGYTIM